MTGYDVIIIGAGAAGMMCGAMAGARGRRVIILDHAKTAGEKIRISGGGRCNFTNLHCGPDNFISANPHFCKSALAGYSPQDFIDLVDRYKIKWHEKTLGQLFCDERSTQIVGMLKSECNHAGAAIKLETQIISIQKKNEQFTVHTSQGKFTAGALVIACGGPSIPKMGATGFGYKIAEQFGLNLIEPVPALVPLMLTDGLKSAVKTLAGLSLHVRVQAGNTSFEEAMLFTHRGLSGPAILQISSYWRAGGSISINLAPNIDILEELASARTQNPKQSPAVFLSNYMPKRLAIYLADISAHARLADMSSAAMQTLASSIHNWQIKPAGSEGFRTAEVTRGGVDTNELSSKTMESKTVNSLYFIGEVVDVTGHLGGHNFQWAWASAAACGRAL